MDLTIMSKITANRLLDEGRFPENAAVVSYYDPPETREAGYGPVDFRGQAARVMYVCLPDVAYDKLAERGYTIDGYFTEAGNVARFLKDALRDGLRIICQCDWGIGRSAGTGAALLQYTEGRALEIFTDYLYVPNKIVYKKVLAALNDM